MILLGLKVSVGQLLTLRNSTTGEEAACPVVYVSPHESEKQQVGIDFMKPCPRFWRISFPPPDWPTQSPEAKGSPRRPSGTPQNSKQQKGGQALDLELFLELRRLRARRYRAMRRFARRNPPQQHSLAS